MIDNKNLNDLYSEIRSILINSYNETYEFSKGILKNSENSKFNDSLKNKWFNKELKNIKEKIMFLKKNFTKSNQIKFEIKKLKKDFRSWQRYSIYLREQKEYSKLNKISKLKDKNKFWRFINNSKRKRSVRKCISLDFKIN